MEDLTGKQLGPYQIVAPLGEGGMAAVYKAYQPRMDRYVAMKILPRHFAADPEFVTRFSQEARVIANLQHPHILPVHDFGEADGYTYLVMRFIEGGTLSNWLIERQPISLDKAVGVVAQVGGALDYAHAQGVVHRDIKPGNILVDNWDNCLLTDFGLAKIVESSAHLTQTGGILGTPAYMSPEQGLGRKIDSRSDIYSLGVVLYQMAVGYLPYQAETPMAVVIKHIHDPLPPPRQRVPDLPEAVELVILKSLAKNPEDRFATAGDLVTALLAAVELPTVRASRPPSTSVRDAAVDQATVLEADVLPAEVDSELMPEMVSESEPGVAPAKEPELSSEMASALAFESDLTEMLSEPAAASPPIIASEEMPPLERTELLSETEMGLDPAVAVPDAPAGATVGAEGSGEVQQAPIRPAPPASAVPASVPQAGVKQPEKSRLPWVLAGVAVVAVVAVIAMVALGLFSADEEEPTVVTEFDAAALTADISEDVRDVEEVALDEAEAAEPNADDELPQETELVVSMEELRQEIEAAYNEGEMFRALVLLENAINLKPDLAGLYCERAYAYGNLQEFREASADFEQCMRLAEDQGLPELAREARGNVALYQARMHIYEEDNYDLALVILEEALSDPAVPGWLLCERAEIFLSLDDPDAALNDFEMCLTRGDMGGGWEIRAQVAIHQILGERALSEDEPLAALEHFSQWAELEPEAPWPHCYMGDILNSFEQADEALAAFERCGSVSDDPDARNWALTSSLELRTHIARENENWDEAMALYEERIRLSPEEAWLYCDRADMFLQLDAREESRADIEACRERSGDDPGILEWVEGLLQELEARSG